MKNEKTLEQKIARAIKNLPKAKDELKIRHERTQYIYLFASVDDVESFQTNDYKVVVSLWHEIYDEEFGGDSQWKNWMEIYYQKKYGRELKVEKTEEIVIKDQYDEIKDKRYLWEYKYAYYEKLAENKLKVGWANEEGQMGPRYIIDLK